MELNTYDEELIFGDTETFLSLLISNLKNIQCTEDYTTKYLLLKNLIEQLEKVNEY